MKRRTFICSGTAAAAAFVSMTSPSHAFQIQQCAETRGNPGCAEAQRHMDLLAEIRATLADETLSPEKRQEILQTVSCPMCGQFLLAPPA